mmetsp:Transcript_32730/g.79338  ORF Transcript_32730/g.79338 Transcript_32730/m.79338 type:complete len:181 (+) Transcript_32730:45-587(+)|eukprot:CAMPEP_0113633052 /NCGR_PEP_ID=MMETSP0017_2-20120614/17190_1 /TAXON_ID=2856 /ORGANISM="Cylindrotheca closterium" /LENGTH=180 /DNA_ID=CAMNT_0000543653 /DNA_START=42 /DNA_END=584 /DNA_ORIENTATION=- /assembly_acc=CAM_ASM_000147
MELERQSSYQSCKTSSLDCESHETERDDGKLRSNTPNNLSNGSIVVLEEPSSSPRHWNNRRVKLFAVKALAIIVLLGYVGHERWLSAVQKVNSRRRLTYVSPSNKSSALQAALSFSTSSRLSQTAQQQPHQHLSVESTNNTTTTSLRGISESKAKARSPSPTTGKAAKAANRNRVGEKDD